MTSLPTPLPAASAPEAARPQSSRWDRLGIVASVACAVHCLAAPLLLLFVPVMGAWWSHPAAHWLLAALVLPLAGWMVLRGYRRHRRRTALVALVLGAVLILAGALLPHLGGSLAQASVRLGPAPSGPAGPAGAAAAGVPTSPSEFVSSLKALAGDGLEPKAEAQNLGVVSTASTGAVEVVSAVPGAASSPLAPQDACVSRCAQGGVPCAGEASEPAGALGPAAAHVSAAGAGGHDACCPAVAFDPQTGRASLTLPAGSLTTIVGSLLLILAHGLNLYHGGRCAKRGGDGGCDCSDA